MAPPGSRSSRGQAIGGLAGKLGVALGAGGVAVVAACVATAGCSFGPTQAGARADAGVDASADASTDGSKDARPALDGPSVSTAAIQCSGPDASAPIVTAHADSMRTGWYPDQPGLNPAVVGGSTFGHLFKTKLPLASDSGNDGGPDLRDTVTAQPLVLGSTVFVATESNNIYAIDAETGAVKASRSLGQNLTGADVMCEDLPPIGIEGTPVIDATTGTAYFFSKTWATSSSAAVFYAHAVDVATLVERPGFPVDISSNAVADNDPTFSFPALAESQRPGLLLTNGVVYAAFGSHCDQGNYRGFVVGVSVDGRVTARFATEVGTDVGGLPNRGGGVWQAGGGIVSDGPGRLLLVSSNGYTTTPMSSPVPGKTPPAVLDESVVRLRVQQDGTLAADDFFTPYDVALLDQENIDFGSGGPLALPDCFGTPATPHLLLSGGKQGRIFVLNRDSLGGFLQGPSGGDALVSTVDARDAIFSFPAVWPGDGGWLYLAPTHAPFQAFAYGRRADGAPTFVPVGSTSDNFGVSSGSPIVTSDGTVSGSALVWVGYATGQWGSGALRAYDPIPDSTGAMRIVYEDAYGQSSKFGAPGVGKNRIYIGTSDGYLVGYGAKLTTSVSGPPVDFGSVVIGQRATNNVVVTATLASNVTAVTSDNPAFVPGTPAPSLPAALAGGAKLVIPVTFTPLSAGGYVGAVALSTSMGSVAVSLRGTGESATPQLVVAPRSLAFQGVPPGVSQTLDLVLSNGGAAPLQLLTVQLPRAPYQVVAPPSGGVIAPGQAVTVQVQYSPVRVGMYADSIQIQTNAGTRTINLTGTCAPPPHLWVSSVMHDFGYVAVGSQAMWSFSLGNDGGTPLEVTTSKPPSTLAFSATTSLMEGTTLDPDASVTETVAFHPVGPRSATDEWRIDTSAGGGVTVVYLQGTAVPPDGGLPDAGGD